jgi:hypothetical protein
LAHSTTHTYRVSAINAIGTSSPSNIATATTFNVVPTVPLGLVAVTNSTTQINLFWTEPLDNGGTPITGFKIERAVGTGAYSILVSNTGNNSTRYLNSGLSSGTTYTYRVSAINAIGTSTPSLNSSSTAFVSSINPRLDSSGEQRASYYDGTRNWIFYYDGSTNLVYRCSSDDGVTLSSSSSTASGPLASNSYFGVYGESNKVVITWSSTTNVFTKTGTISGTTITWSPSVSVFGVSMTNAGQQYYPSFEKVGNNLFLGFNVVTKGKNVGNVYVSTNLGSSWASGTSLYSNQAQPGIVGVAKYANTKALAIFAGYADTQFTYKTFSGTSWSSKTSSISGAGLTANVLKTNAFSIASNGTCAWAGYLASNNGGPVKSMIFCDTTKISFPATGITTTNLQPSLSDIGSEVRLLYQRGNSIYRITTAGGLWGLESVAVQNTYNPTFLHAQKIGGSSSYLPVVWREGAASPFTVRFALDAGLRVPTYESVWEDHNSMVGNQALLIMTDPPLNTGADWWWARAFVYEAVMINLNGEGAAGAGFAKYIPLGQTTPVIAGVAYSYQSDPEVQTYYFGNPVSQSKYYVVKLMPNNCWNMYLDVPNNFYATDCLEDAKGNPVLINGGLPTYIVWSNTMQNSPGDFQTITVKKNINDNFGSLAKFSPNVYCTTGEGKIYNIKNITPGSEDYELQFGSTTGPNSSCSAATMPDALGWGLPG